MRQMKRVMRLSTLIGSTCLLLMLMVGPAQATPLNLQLVPAPDITAGFIDVSYDVVTHQLVAIGLAIAFENDGVAPPENIFSAFPSYNITATIDELGNFSSGTLEITGAIPSLAIGSGTLLTGDLIAFGFPDVPGGDIFEFLFTVTGGSLESLFTPVVATILDGNFDGAFDGTFTQNFANPPFAGSNDSAPPVPEPGTIFLLLTGLGGLYSLRKLRGVKF